VHRKRRGCEISRGRRCRQGDVDGKRVDVELEPLVMRGLQQEETAADRVIGRNDEAIFGLVEFSALKDLLQRRAQRRVRMLGAEQLAQQSGNAEPARGRKNRRTHLPIEIPDGLGGDSVGDAQCQDSAGRGAGDEVEIVADRAADLVLDLGQNGSGECALDAATVQAQDSKHAFPCALFGDQTSGPAQQMCAATPGLSIRSKRQLASGIGPRQRSSRVRAFLNMTILIGGCEWNFCKFEDQSWS
jgi:hypothetical protein